MQLIFAILFFFAFVENKTKIEISLEVDLQIFCQPEIVDDNGLINSCKNIKIEVVIPERAFILNTACKTEKLCVHFTEIKSSNKNCTFEQNDKEWISHLQIMLVYGDFYSPKYSKIPKGKIKNNWLVELDEWIIPTENDPIQAYLVEKTHESCRNQMDFDKCWDSNPERVENCIKQIKDCLVITWLTFVNETRIPIEA